VVCSSRETLHSGMDETSGMLAVRPDLIDPKYRSAKTRAGEKMEDLVTIATSKDWPGYFGSHG